MTNAARETPRAIAAYECYRDLGVNRSLKAVADSLDVALGTVTRWSYSHGWVTRVSEYDRSVATVADERSREDEAQRRVRMREDRLAHAETLQARALDALLAKDPKKWRGSDIVDALKLAWDTTRRDTGDDVKRQEISGPDGGAIVVQQDVTAHIMALLAPLRQTETSAEPSVIELDSAGNDSPNA